MIIYLAGGMKTGWQDRVAAHLAGHELLDPRSWSDPDPKIYTERDLSAIRKSDALLVQMGSDNPSGFGLSVELGYAKALCKHIVFLDQISDDWRSRYFGMHREMADKVCTTVDEAITAIMALSN